MIKQKHIVESERHLPSLKTPRVDEKSSVQLWRTLAHCSAKEARSFLSFEHARRLGVLPVGLHQSGKSTSLVVFFPSSPEPELLKDVQFACGIDVIVETTEPDLLRKAITAAYQGDSTLLEQAGRRANTRCPTPNPTSSGYRLAKIEEEPIPALLRSIIHRGIYLDASDIHIEPQENSVRLRYRVDGILREDGSFNILPSVAISLSRRIKILAKLDSTATRKAQEGGFSFQEDRWNVRLRVSIIPQIFSEKVVLRLLHNSFLDSFSHSASSSFSSLGLTSEQSRLLNLHMAADHGVLLLSGPTGSGKSTLLYAMLLELNREWRNILTLEDPIERVIPGITQTEVSTEQGMGYRELLPRLLRQDPDVIMIGEVRDKETAITALEAGITGSLVLSTVHAGNCLEIMVRLLQLGVSPSLIEAATSLLISGRLLARNCTKCLTYTRPTDGLAKMFHLDSGVRLGVSVGCEYCDHTGTAGRLGVYESLSLNPKLREAFAIAASNSSSYEFSFNVGAFREAAYREGFRPYLFPVREALLETTISPHTALRAAGISPEFAGG